MTQIPEAIHRLQKGEMIIIVDDEQRENEGDLVIAGEFITTEQMAFIIRHTGGVVCLSLSPEIADKLDLPDMVHDNTSKRSTSFTVSIDAAEGIESGISAADRVVAIKAVLNPDAKPTDVVRPGHVFPLRAQNGGVLWRAGHTEASIDLCKIAGLKEAAVISELMNDDGTVMRGASLSSFAQAHGLLIISVADIIAYRHQNETFIELAAQSEIKTQTGDWSFRVYNDLLKHTEHVALVKGEIKKDEPILVRVHSECMTGDLFSSLHCDCGAQLHKAMEMIEQEGKGVLLYMKQEGRGIGLVNKIKAYELQHKKKMDTVEANVALGFPEDLREYGVGAQILKDIGCGKIRLMTNNPKKMGGISGYGIDVVEQVPIEIPPNGIDNEYLKTKKTKMCHLLHLL